MAWCLLSSLLPPEGILHPGVELVRSLLLLLLLKAFGLQDSQHSTCHQHKILGLHNALAWKY